MTEQSCDLSKYINQNVDLGKELKVKLLRGFRVTRVLGQGAYGKVYLLLLQDPKTQESSYALKVIELLNDEENKEKFKNEMEIFNEFSKKGFLSLSTETVCKHDNINCYLGIENKDNICGYILMKYFNTDLLREIEKKGSFEKNITLNPQYFFDQFIKWVKELFEAVHYLHKEGAAHGDIKPNNILVNLHDNSLAITDFDTFCFHSSTNICKVTDITPLYASPQLNDSLNKEVSIQVIQTSDWWAIALVILEMWFGQEKIREILYGRQSANYFPLHFYDSIKSDKDIFNRLGHKILDSTNKVKQKLEENKIPNFEKITSTINSILIFMVSMLSKIAKGQNIDIETYFEKIRSLNMNLTETHKMTQRGGKKYIRIKKKI